MLSYYSERLSTVELNNTFYRMPKEDALRTWADTTPPGFCFAPKAPQQITHRLKLAGAADAAGYLFRTLAALGDKLGPILFQLPPFLRKDLPRLTDFLALIPPGTKTAFEFRHASWFDDSVFQALASAGAALCIAEAEDLATPLVATTDWGYLRLRRMDYEEPALKAWVDRLVTESTPHPATSRAVTAWHSTFVYFKHEEAGRGPQLASVFARVLAGIPNVSVASTESSATAAPSSI